MIPEDNLKISLKELSSRGFEILARQPPISYKQALQQVQRLKQQSKVGKSLKKSGSGS